MEQSDVSSAVGEFRLPHDRESPVFGQPQQNIAEGVVARVWVVSFAMSAAKNVDCSFGRGVRDEAAGTGGEVGVGGGEVQACTEGSAELAVVEPDVIARAREPSGRPFLCAGRAVLVGVVRRDLRYNRCVDLVDEVVLRQSMRRGMVGRCRDSLPLLDAAAALQ